jgi:predicted nucleic acid-binding protein
MLRVVISDTSPLHYLILIGHAEILPALYTEVLIPEAVADELRHAGAPEVVIKWLAGRPSWLQIVSPLSNSGPHSLRDLDAGERDAILLAVQVQADLLLMDDREGVEEARRLGLSTTGTLGVLVRAAERGLIDLPAAIRRLRETNFRVDPILLERISAPPHEE